MLDHVGLEVTDLDRSIPFYQRALAPLGYVLIGRFGDHAGFGVAGKPDFWIGKGAAGRPVHVAFRTDRRSLVKAFHSAALDAGGRDHGAPGVRADYHPHYYGAFVLDPDGHNIEAVCHEPYLG
jgi:catechol 2,3-dioxygenase-like lactoylglutathione lyase family enzyme